MARKVYKVRSLPLRGGIRGGRADENARPSRRRRTGKTDAEHERLRAREKGVEDSAIAERGGDRPAVEEPEEGASRRLSIGRRPLKRIPAQLRHKSIEDACGMARRKRGVFPEPKKPLTLLGETAPGKERPNLAVKLPALRLSAGERRRLNLAMPGNSASASRPALSDRRRRTRAQPPKVLRESQTRRSNGLLRSPLFKNAARLNHSDEESAMAHGAGRLARKTASLMGAAAMQAAKAQAA